MRCYTVQIRDSWEWKRHSRFESMESAKWAVKTDTDILRLSHTRIVISDDEHGDEDPVYDMWYPSIHWHRVT